MIGYLLVFFVGVAAASVVWGVWATGINKRIKEESKKLRDEFDAYKKKIESGDWK